MKKVIISMGLAISTGSLMFNLSACHKAPSCDGTTPTYKDDASLVLNKNCALSGCHVAGFANGDFSTYSGAVAKKDDIKSQVVSKGMPPSGSLSDNDIQTISCWVENGCPE